MKNVMITLGLLVALLIGSETTFAQNSKLIVYRKGCIYGSLARYQVVLDGNKVGRIKNNQIMVSSVAPGKHTVSPKQKKRAVTFNANAGQDYVVVYKTRIGIFGGRPKLKVMTVAMAKKEYKHFRMNADAKMNM